MQEVALAISGSNPSEWFSSWVYGAMLLAVVVSVVFLAGILWLRREVRLQTRELEVAKKLAESASKAKSEFLANMSHEIRTPLNAVIGMTDLVLDMPLEREQKKYLEIVLSSAEALLALLNSILDFSKIEAGRMELETIVFPLLDPVTSACDTVAVNAHRKELEIYLDLAPGIPDMVRGDPFRLRQILINLVNNAIKFTQKGEIIVQVSATPAADEQHANITFAVQDTGIGIAKDKLEKIFESFTQADGSTTRHYGGTGLGLTISQQLVDMMGGRLEVSSQEGEGSRFYFTLTCETVTYPSQGIIRQPLQGLRVVLGDVSPTHVHLVGNLLQGMGAEVTIEESGSAVWQRMVATGDGPESLGMPFDVFLIGHKLWNGADGSDLSQQLAQREDLCKKTIAMLPAHRRKDDPHLDRGPHVGSILVKPAHPERILAAVQSIPEVGLIIPGLLKEHSGRDKTRSNVFHILVVEDEPSNQQVVTDVLERAGHVWKLAKDGPEALELLNREVFDLVFLDILLPGMDGFSLTRTIRNKPINQPGTGPQVIIIGNTGHIFQGDREKCLEAGMDGFLPKPFRPRDLLSVIQRFNKQLVQKRGARKKNSDAKIIQLPKVGTNQYSAALETVFVDWSRIMTRLVAAIAVEDFTGVASLADELKVSSHQLGADLLRNESFKMVIATRDLRAQELVRERFVTLESEYLKAVMVVVMAESERLNADTPNG